MKLIWLPVAIEDLDSIYRFYEGKNQKSAAKIYNSILDEAEMLKKFPTIGKAEPLLRDFSYTFRSLVVKSGQYKIIHYIVEDKIYISHVWDCRQNPKTLKEKTTKI